MKIKKIYEIKNLATFTDFHWKDGYNEFKQYNFFYGWNYSGKTTISRIFRCLEDKKAHTDFPNAQFKLETDEGNITERDIGKDFNFRVFNEEFVEANFKWNDENHEINPVLLLGKESIELENRVKELTKVMQDKKKLLDEKSNKKKTREDYLRQSLTDKASNIRSILGITNPRDFDKNALDNKINEIKDNYKTFILSDGQYESLLSTMRNTTQYEIISEVNIQLKLINFIEDVKNILSRKVSAQQIIEKLKDNPKLANWVREGINLHKDETYCQFCGNKLPSDLFDRLNKHFSDEYEKLIKEIKNKEGEFYNHKDEIDGFQMPDKTRFFPEFQSYYEEKKKSSMTELDSYVKSLKVLLNKLEEKREKPFDDLDFGNINNNQQTIVEIITAINKIIADNNQQIQNLSNEKQQAREKVIKHLVAKSIGEIRIFAIKRLIGIYDKHIARLENEISTIQTNIEYINSQIKAEAIGAKKIDVYLTQFFNHDELSLEVLDNGKYRIFRDGEVAKNLSTGERNIISLIYFFARLEEKNFDLSRSIIFIDDPVSSLDSNHTFKVYGFLNEKLKDCGQLFITTHNFDFFNLLKDFSKYDLCNKGVFFLIKKISNNNGEKKSVIENLPAVLLKFKSEYNYLFSILKDFNETRDKSNFGLLYLMPNIARRFLEAYLFIRYPDGKKFKDKVEKFFQNEDVSDKQGTLKLLDEYSHEESPEHSQKLPSIEEVEISVKFVLEAIDKKDNVHYISLCESLNANSN